MREASKGRKSYNRKRGGRINRSGYTEIYKPEHPGANSMGYIREHRFIAGEALGRPLKKDEIVHHINGDKVDNRNCNLLICNESYHQWLERKMAYLYKKEHFTHV